MTLKYNNPATWLFVGKAVGIGAVGIFAGQALGFSNFLMPALRKFSATSSLNVWCEAYTNASPLQAACAVVSSVCLGGVYAKTGSKPFLLAAIGMLSVIPYTLVLMMPINKELLSIRKSGGASGDHVEALLQRWESRHQVRIVVSIAALGASLYGALGGGHGGLSK
ncbi:hypothetical protein DFQ27_003348 [Actinomortierella ambigua]|uniref:DUF1772-domain-containing protein n=1 Tax=Actinomortierella ambigua TaxID=1343610 RepID=A0A9P6U4X7_9FUNG|nr:hypothetical protein DFQ27_003348 [Actinomortierella ambigua]